MFCCFIDWNCLRFHVHKLLPSVHTLPSQPRQYLYSYSLFLTTCEWIYRFSLVIGRADTRYELFSVCVHRGRSNFAPRLRIVLIFVLIFSLFSYCIIVFFSLISLNRVRRTDLCPSVTSNRNTAIDPRQYLTKPTLIRCDEFANKSFLFFSFSWAFLIFIIVNAPFPLWIFLS